MLRHFFKVALRQIRNRPLYTTINIFGLAFGLGAALLIGLYIQDEVGYDQHIPRSEDIYRVTGLMKHGGDAFEGPIVAPPMAAYLQENWPEVEEAVRLYAKNERLFGREGGRTVSIPNTLYADANSLDFFGVEMQVGNPRTALEAPNSMVISQQVAEQLFPHEDAVGQSLKVNQGRTFTVAGIMQDWPEKSHFQPEILLSLSTLESANTEQWYNFNYFTYIRLKNGTDPLSSETKFAGLVEEKFSPLVPNAFGMSWEEFLAGESEIRFGLQPLEEIYLTSSFSFELGEIGSLRNLYLLGAIAVFLLLMAAINFINLSTARASVRAREVGIRKVLGAHRSQLVKQFLGESILMSLFGMAIALFLAERLLPIFASLAGKSLTIPYDQPVFWLITGLLILLNGTLAGLYPAFYLSHFQPIGIIQGSQSKGAKSSRFRRPLVVVQFAISVGLMLASATVYQQIQFLQAKDLGFDKEQILIVENTFTLGDRIIPLSQELRQLPEVKRVSMGDYLPLNGIQNNKLHWPKGQRGEAPTFNMEFWEVDTAFIQTFGIRLTEGRGFNQLASDTASMILNRKAATAFGFGQDAVGQLIETYGQNNLLTYQVIGIIEDVHYQGFEQEIGPMGVVLGQGNSHIALKLNAEKVRPTLEALSLKWATFSNGQDLSYSFMDERFAHYYARAERLGNLLLAFTLLIMVIACMGLFALASYLAEQRSHEMGIRKVLGASTWQLVRLMIGEFVRLVGLALVFALPIVFYLIQDWLSAYAYRINLWEIGPWLALGTGFSVLLISLLTVSVQSLRAATTNPADVLRDQ